MYTENLILGLFVTDETTKWHIFEHVINLLENTVRVIDVFSESFSTLLSKTKIPIDVAVFMVSSKQENLFRVFELESHQQADYLKTLAASVHIVSKEEVVKATYVTCLTRGLPQIKEAHKIAVVTVNISEYFDRGLQVLD